VAGYESLEDEVWANECALVEADAARGMQLEQFMRLYTLHGRSAKADYEKIFGVKI
jgi:hypothetical protein